MPRVYVRIPIEERFWKKVVKTSECWLWTGKGRASYGYGVIGKPGHGAGNYMAHRVSWEIHNGPIPSGMAVCHKCDVPICVNPNHLFLGTQKDNLRDMTLKGRRVTLFTPETTSGVNNSNARLTDEQVADIRRLGGTMSQQRIADQFGITQVHVSRLLHNKQRA